MEVKHLSSIEFLPKVYQDLLKVCNKFKISYASFTSPSHGEISIALLVFDGYIQSLEESYTNILALFFSGEKVIWTYSSFLINSYNKGTKWFKFIKNTLNIDDVTMDTLENMKDDFMEKCSHVFGYKFG